MSRVARSFLKFPSPTYYHLISHLQDELSFLSPSEKEYLLRLLKKLTSVFSIRLVSYALLGNHFHLLIRAEGEDSLSEAEAVDRALLLYPEGVVRRRSGLYWKSKLSDISYFMKELNQRFSQHYNRLRGRRGHVFYERFKSIVLDTSAVLAVSVYIDLNGVRAGVSKRVGGYRWLSYTARRAGKGRWLIPLEEALGMDFSSYEELLSEVGRLEREGKGKVEEEEVPLAICALQYRGEGLVYGSRIFVEGVLGRLPHRRRRRVEVGGLVLA